MRDRTPTGQPPGRPIDPSGQAVTADILGVSSPAPAGSSTVRAEGEPRLLGELAGDFLLSARVSVDFAAAFDAGVLLLHAGDDVWAKLCFEYSPQGHPMVVSVVNRGVSDDANAFTVGGHTVWLRIARIGAAYAFHASTGGERWEFVRHFTLDTGHPVRVGFAAQSPTGEGCTATFDRLTYRPDRLGDLRDGR